MIMRLRIVNSRTRTVRPGDTSEADGAERRSGQVALREIPIETWETEEFDCAIQAPGVGSIGVSRAGADVLAGMKL